MLVPTRTDINAGMRCRWRGHPFLNAPTRWSTEGVEAARKVACGGVSGDSYEAIFMRDNRLLKLLGNRVEKKTIYCKF